MRFFIVAIFLFLVSSTTVYAGAFEDAQHAFEQEDYQTAMKLWQPLADQGNAEAQRHIGWFYRQGVVVPTNRDEAMKWYLKADAQENAAAQNDIGEMELERARPSANVHNLDAENTAINWFTKAARNGNANAATHLGALYASRLEWANSLIAYLKAANEGSAEAQNKLGEIYQFGYGVVIDLAKAIAWYQRSAYQDYDHAQRSLGLSYAEGKSISQDYVQAYMWCNLAGRNNKHFDCSVTFTRAMTPEQVSAAKKLVENWKPSPETTTAVDEPALFSTPVLRARANQGDAFSQFAMGRKYAEKEHDDVEAEKLFTKAAEQGYKAAQVYLARAYTDGRGVNQDFSEAAKWFSKAAEQGDSYSQWQLGRAYKDGRGVKQDYSEALKWLRAASGKDALNSGARHDLGLMYRDGLGVPQDSEEAYFWLALAVVTDQENFFPNFSHDRDDLEKKLTPEQLEKIRKRVRESPLFPPPL